MFDTLFPSFTMYRLQARYHKPGEKRKHFSYPDYFTCKPGMVVTSLWTKGPDNQGCTIFVLIPLVSLTCPAY